MSEIILKPLMQNDIDSYIWSCDLAAMTMGFSSSEELENYKVEAAEGMIKFGGSFTYYLGFALAHADTVNTGKLIKAFRPMCDEFREMHLKFMRERDNA